MTNLRRTSLYEEHLRLNAKIVPFAGWEMPVQYTSVKDEALAVRNAAGVFDVSHMGEFFLEGPEAEAFADYLVTNDVAGAQVGKAIYSPLCRENGTVIDDLIVYKLAPGRVLICVNASNIQKDFDWIRSRHQGFNCELRNASDEFSLIALQGPRSSEMLKRLIRDLPDLEYYSVFESSFDSRPIIIARTGYTGEDGFEVFGGHETIAALWTGLTRAGVVPCGLAARDVLRLEVCYPLYGHELNDETTPYDAGLGWTVKLSKENFIGKEALTPKPAKKKLVKLKLDKGIPREGYKVMNGKGEAVGVVTSGSMSVVLNTGIALASIDRGYTEEEYSIDIRGKAYPATLVKQPFVNGGHK
jgi:aminomethyltransferase